jgi:Domain of unknown function (DUF4278)
MFVSIEIPKIKTVKYMTEYPANPIINKSGKNMKLIYRGTTYNYNPAQAKVRSSKQITQKTAHNLIYRGNTYRFDPTIAKLATGKPSSYELIYRGSTLHMNRNAAGEVTAITCSTNIFQPKMLVANAVSPAAFNEHLL